MLTFYASKGEELAAVRRAAARAGCTVTRANVGAARLVIGAGFTSVDEGSGADSVVGRLMCRDGWQAARLLLALAIEDSRTPGARRIAAELRAVAPNDDDFARAVHAYVLARVRFVRENGEIFQSGAVTLNRGAGDCDDMFRLVYALVVAGGVPAKLAILHHGDNVPPAKRGPAHAVAVLCPGGYCAYAETSVRASYGEKPNAAAARLGLTNERSDIATEVVIMTEADLPPLPEGFRDRNDAAQVALDCEALQRLGYLAADVAPCKLGDPTDPIVRQAVAEFQRARGLVVDGLLGPTTRLTIASALREAGTEGFDYPGLSGVGDVPVKVTGDLTDSFLQAVVAMAARFRARGATATAEDFLRCWMNESGISSHRPNAAGAPYYGLNQMGLQEQAAAGFHGTAGDWLSLSNEQQLPYVERFYINAINSGAHGDFSTLRDAGSVYVATFAPALMHLAGDPDASLYDSKTAPGAYRENRQFDTAGKGFISVGDLAAAVAGFDTANNATGVRWREVKARVAALGGATSSGGGGVGGAVAALGVLGVGVGAALAAWWSQ